MERSRDPAGVEDELLFREFLQAVPAAGLDPAGDPPDPLGPGSDRALAADSVGQLDIAALRKVLDAFLSITGMSMALVSSSGLLLASSNWQPICTRYFRAHPVTRKACEATDQAVNSVVTAAAGRREPAQPSHYQCANGLREIALPLFVEGVHWATLFLGQFLYDDDPADEAALRDRARAFGWPEEDFLEAFRAVPRFGREEVDRSIAFCGAFGDLVTRMNYSIFRQRLMARHYFRVDEELAQALEQKEFLFAELQHRVKNSLSLIASLLSLEAASLGDEGTRAILQEAQGRIRSVALLYERLYATGSVETIDLGSYLDSAFRAAVQAAADPARPIELESGCASLRIDTRRAVYAGLVAHELAVNCMKHAFAGRPGGRIRLSLREEGDRISLEVADDGVGLPPGFSPEGRSSMGMQVVTTLARQLDGAIELGPGLPGGPGPGVAFRLSFPVRA